MNNIQNTKNIDEQKIPIFDFQQILELFKQKDMNQYSENELKIFNEMFKYSGYNIDLLNLKNLKNN
jgi:hypothetical protein